MVFLGVLIALAIGIRVIFPHAGENGVGILGGSPPVAQQPSERSAQADAPTDAGIVVKDFACGGDKVYAWATGHVWNGTNAKLRGIKITASFYARDKSLIDTGWGYADMTPVLPGQTSTFKVYGPRNQNVKSCSIDGAQ